MCNRSDQSFFDQSKELFQCSLTHFFEENDPQPLHELPLLNTFPCIKELFFRLYCAKLQKHPFFQSHHFPIFLSECIPVCTSVVFGNNKNFASWWALWKQKFDNLTFCWIHKLFRSCVQEGFNLNKASLTQFFPIDVARIIHFYLLSDTTSCLRPSTSSETRHLDFIEFVNWYKYQDTTYEQFRFELYGWETMYREGKIFIYLIRHETALIVHSDGKEERQPNPRWFLHVVPFHLSVSSEILSWLFLTLNDLEINFSLDSFDTLVQLKSPEKKKSLIHEVSYLKLT